MRASRLMQNRTVEHCAVRIMPRLPPGAPVRLAVMAALRAMPAGQPLRDHWVSLLIRLTLHSIAVAPATYGAPPPANGVVFHAQFNEVSCRHRPGQPLSHGAHANRALRHDRVLGCLRPMSDFAALQPTRATL